MFLIKVTVPKLSIFSGVCFNITPNYSSRFRTQSTSLAAVEAETNSASHVDVVTIDFRVDLHIIGVEFNLTTKPEVERRVSRHRAKSESL